MKKEVLSLLILLLSLSVYAQEFGVSPLKMNIMYMGVENPLRIVVENHSCDSIIISSNVKLQKIRPCNYIAIPGNISVANFNLAVIKNNDNIRIGRSQFRVHKTPDPVVSVGGRKDGTIPKGFLLSQPGLKAVLEYDFIFDAEYKIKSYTVVIEREDEKVFSKDFEGNRFPAELKAQFSNAYPGDTLRFENVVASGPEGSDRELAPASFKIN
jgi:hypothetical protein